jgi:hypothetical protein
MAFPNYICFGNFSELLVILFATSVGCDISQGFFKKNLFGSNTGHQWINLI